MSRIIASIAVAIMATSAAAAPMRNVASGQCILADYYDSDLDEYTLRMGACGNKFALDFDFNGKYISTDDDYCLSFVDGEVIAEACLPNKRQRWTLVSSF